MCGPLDLVLREGAARAATAGRPTLVTYRLGTGARHELRRVSALHLTVDPANQGL